MPKARYRSAVHQNRRIGHRDVAVLVLALVMAMAAMASCGVSAGDGASDSTPTTTVATTSTSSPVLPGLDAIPGDRLPRGTDRYDDGGNDGEGDTGPDDTGIDEAWEVRHRAALEAYVELCETDDRACDVLFLITEEGTDEEALAASCSGRQPGTGFCTPGIELDDEWYADEDDAAVLDLADDCRADDGVACDLLGLVLREGVPLSALGFTCNDRFPDGPAISCATDL